MTIINQLFEIYLSIGIYSGHVLAEDKIYTR